jgi:MFS family permease
MTTNIDFEAAEQKHPELKAFYDNKRLFFINVFWLVVGGAAASLGISTVSTTMPLHMAKIGLDAEQISSIMAFRGYLALPLALYLAQLSDQWQSKRGRRLPFLAASIPFMVVGMWLFPYTRSLLGCILIFTIFNIGTNVKYDTYPFIAYDIARKKYWGRVNGLNLVFGGIGTWLGQVILMPMMDTRGENYVYMLASIIVGVASVLTVMFSKEPPIRSETKPTSNPIAVIKHVIKVGFTNKRHIQLFIANGLVCGGGLVGFYIPLQALVNLHMTQGAIGHDVLQYGTIASTAIAFFMGWGIDKIGSSKTVLLGLILAVIAMILGFNPNNPTILAAFGAMLKPLLGLTNSNYVPTKYFVLAVANIFVVLSGTFIYWAQHIFAASCIRREDLATFGTCNGAVIQLIGAILLQISGILIKRVFGGNYGYAFIIGAIIAGIGVPMFFRIERQIKKERADYAEANPASAPAE